MTRNDAVRPEAVDVIVLGSGAAGLTAALTASAAGLSVLILEKSDKIGGTSAMSGAGTWVPANHHARAKGIEDSKAQALAYIEAVLPDEWKNRELPRWRAFVDNAPDMLAFVEAHTPIEFEVLSEPDPVLEAPGAVKYGRMLSPRPMKIRAAIGGLARQLRGSTQPHDLTYEEMIWANFIRRPVSGHIRQAPKILRRKLGGYETQGSALIAGLLSGCLRQGCILLTGAQASALDQEPDGSVTGVRYVHDGQERITAAARGVVIATGGFEWDREMYAAHFPEQLDFLCTPRTNTGDGQKMAAAAGAEMAQMDQANVAGALPTRYEGEVHGMPLRFQANRYAIVVNRAGRRFGNEYDFNFGEHLLERDRDTGEYPNLPAWVIADSRILEYTPILPYFARHRKGWLVKAPTLTALAGKISVPPLVLEETVARFNAFAQSGKDEDFGRGDSKFDKLISGKRGTMAPLETPPFVAMPFNISLMGTKGGPMTDEMGRVVRPDGSVIPGLFAAGNAMANPFGTRAVGTGTTIGPVMTWGYICGNTLAGTGTP